MKAGDIILWIFGAFCVFILWTAFGPEPRPPANAAAGCLPQVAQAITSGKPVLLEFSAGWCGACVQVKPEVEAFAKEIGTQARVVQINVDENQTFSQAMNIRSIPCFIAYRDGKEISRKVGGMPRAEMKRMLGL